MTDINSFFNIFFFILILLFFIWPSIKRRIVQSKRLSFIKNVEKDRGSRVVTLIHRQEALSFLGFPFFRYIDIEDSEKILRAIRFTPEDTPIDLVMHTPGGLVLASEQIARALQKHKGKVTIIVPHHALSGGTLIALAADEILMDDNAVLGPLDPQLGRIYPATSVLEVPKFKPLEKMKDETLIYLDLAYKAVKQVEDLIAEILSRKKIAPANARRIAKTLTSGEWTHDYPLTISKLQEIGIDITPEVPTKVYQLMELYPQAPQARPSVEYVPVPYPKREKKSKEKETSVN